ncbi:MAG: hypothetical protein QF921_05505 [Pseudomonadales bacterium]|jgi:hypothetical protein|nr:hypothetical protein [Pseudomonadales bacterium]MDP6471403.1 hypothetical protein [Pseudomonadales bacterium]MDP6826405.1 hypothetical protein [Pseudomonadales bacterium]MDP6970958.1 hypothetical protein [Pseudomonadales bacterium]|tara:strand:- start:10 stop:207 length:198 start_codon:yes stop_codon:yes gene_type:complete
MEENIRNGGAGTKMDMAPPIDKVYDAMSVFIPAPALRYAQHPSQKQREGTGKKTKILIVASERNS